MTPCALKKTDFRKNVLEAAGTTTVAAKGPYSEQDVGDVTLHTQTVSHPLPPFHYLRKQQQQDVRQFLAYSVFVGI